MTGATLDEEPPDAVTGATLDEESPDAVTGATVDKEPPDAVTGATVKGSFALKPNFLGIPVSVNIHRATGYTSGIFFAASGIVGAVRFADMMERSHQYRTDEEFNDECRAIIRNEWEQGQELRWTHVGLMITGESLYLFDGVTGMSMMGKTGSKAGKIHRTAFFVHAGLMAAEMVLGFLTTDALQRGDHEMIIRYGAAHTAIGIAIPVVILGSGIAVDTSH